MSPNLKKKWQIYSRCFILLSLQKETQHDSGSEMEYSVDLETTKTSPEMGTF